MWFEHRRNWRNFVMRYGRLELTTGQIVIAQQVLIGGASLDLSMLNDVKISHQILKYARVL